MDQIVDVGSVSRQALELLRIVQAYLTSLDFIWQVVAVAATGLVAIFVGPRLRKLVMAIVPGERFSAVRRSTASILGAIAVSGLWLALAWGTLIGARSFLMADDVLRIAVNLLGAWVVIRIGTRIVRNPILSNALFVLAWGFAALNILGLLGPILTELNKAAVNLGTTTITGLTVLKGVIALVLLLWAASALSKFLSERIRTLEQLTPTLKILFSKLLQFVLVTLAVVFALQVVGIPLTAFAVFGGALGVGIGLGLQRAASNIIGGLMLLMDKSIKPGDVIAVGETFGWVTSLGGRYVAVRTRDGIDHLIPNETFITQGIENWSYADHTVRLKVPFNIAYWSDPRRAIAVGLEAAADTERACKSPEPVCIMKAFGESALEMELRFWITDPQNGVGNVKGEVLLRLWEKLKAAGVDVPFPQREVTIKNAVRLEGAAGA